MCSSARKVIIPTPPHPNPRLSTRRVPTTTMMVLLSTTLLERFPTNRGWLAKSKANRRQAALYAAPEMVPDFCS